MPRVIVECPDCGKRLETTWDNAGRDGLCPACEQIFPIPVPWAAEQTGVACAPAEYRDVAVLSGFVVLAACLALALVSIAGDWVHPAAPAAGLAATQKTLVAAVSVACLGFLLASAAARVSFLPALFVVALWGTAAAVWSGGLVSCLLGAAGRGATTEPMAGLYFSLVAVCMITGASAYAFAQYRRASAMSCSWLQYLVAVGAGALFGLVVVAAHVRPTCYALATPPTPAPAEPTYTLARDYEPEPRPPLVPGRKPAQTPPQEPKSEPKPTDEDEPEADEPEATPAQRAPNPPDPAPPPPEPCKYILIEGEAADRQNCERPGVYTDVDRSTLSGNGWLSHMPTRPERKARATYTFVVADQSTYRWWLRLTPMIQGALRYKLDDNPWRPVAAAHTIPSNCGTGSAYIMLAWVRCDLGPRQPEISLSAGTHRLELEFSKVRGASWTAVDCMMFTPAPCEPVGIGPPKRPT